MKAITVLQPYASLIAVGAKQYETRSWATKHRGPIAIHAGKKDWADMLSSAEVYAMMRAFAGTRHEVKPGRYGGDCDYEYPYGAVIAVADLTQIYKTSALDDSIYLTQAGISELVQLAKGLEKSVDKQELLFGDFSPGRFAWELADVKMLKEPVPARGRRGLWTLPPETAAEIMRRIGK
jgi:hypothetical protein